MKDKLWTIRIIAIIIAIIALAFFWVNGWIWVGGAGALVVLILSFAVDSGKKKMDQRITQLKGEASESKHTISFSTAQNLLNSILPIETDWKWDNEIDYSILKLQKLKSFQTCAITLYHRESSLTWIKLAFTKSKGDNFILNITGEGKIGIPIIEELEQLISLTQEAT